ncbi:MAG TPA: MFS transporter, partial [Stellaceae bacterium]|nr:MFS transporter [Stellaceae bacterium]
AFNYSYAPFQLVGGWFADRFGARRTLTLCGLVWSLATIGTGAVTGLASLFGVRLVLGAGEGATLPAATRAISKWTPVAKRGTAIGATHAAGRLGAGSAAPIVAFLITWFSWRFSFVAVGILSTLWAGVWWWYFHEDPRRHPRISSAELDALPATDHATLAGSGPVPWRHLIPRVAPLMIVYFCQGWTGWLFVTWMPSLLQKNYGVEIKKSAFLYMGLLFAGFLAELLGGITTDHLLRRTGSLQIARSLMIAGSWAFAVAGLLPVILFHDMVIGVSGFMVTVFFLGFAISPLWTATMDIAPSYAGTSSSLMNAAGAVAGILSPVAFAWILDRTGSWTMPFAFSVGLLLFAIVMTYWIRPDRPISERPPMGRLAAARG